MTATNLNDLVAFTTVAREGSFTRAAAQLGVSQSAVSHTVTALEKRLGVRLLMRTTRSVSLTEAGERLFQSLSPHLEEIAASLTALSELRDKPAGTIRINASENVTNAVIWPKLAKFLVEYPDINVEICIDYGLANIVEQRFDAGVRLGEQVEKDMVAVRIAPDMRMAVVGAPVYLKGRPLPKQPGDLTSHDCINLRLPTHGGLLPWEFEKDGRVVNVRVEGRLVFNSSTPILNATLAGFGLAYLPESMVLDHVRNKKLIRVLADWCPPFPGYHLYYPSRNLLSPAFRLLVDALRVDA